ncbi:MAG: internal scaffolding protein [Microviridae sp.]|nr:MAG: internal scaffolding protein [Microviridae sp.]
MRKFTVRSAFDYDSDAASLESGLNMEGEVSQTQQQFGEEADINTLVRRFGITGQLPENLAIPQSGDFTGVSDYQTAMNLVVQAQEEFLKVPADVRARFDHDPGRFIAFVDDASNRDEAIRLGLIPKPPEVDRSGGAVS